MTSKIKYSDESLGKIEIVPDFLPSSILVRGETIMGTIEAIEL